MKKALLQHLAQLALVTTVLLVLSFYFAQQAREQRTRGQSGVTQWLEQGFIDWDDPFERALWKDMMDIYMPGQKDEHAELLQDIEAYRRSQVLRSASGEANPAVPDMQGLIDLLGMYIKFAFIYLVTLLLTTYGVQTLGGWRFIRHKQKALPYTIRLFRFWKKPLPRSRDWKVWLKHYQPAAQLALQIFGKGAAYALLFAPAYVIAYSFRTRFDTDFAIFMIVLGVISNAMLITYAHKFYTFLQGESRRGYVETARVKNMQSNWRWSKNGPLSQKNMLHWRKRFPGHLFDHIFRNAAWQYRATLKEQASFLVSGLIIIEMALNIQNHLCYELLQHILYNQWAYVALIVMGIYWLIKLTEIAVDAWTAHERGRMEQ